MVICLWEWESIHLGNTINLSKVRTDFDMSRHGEFQLDQDFTELLQCYLSYHETAPAQNPVAIHSPSLSQTDRLKPPVFSG